MVRGRSISAGIIITTFLLFLVITAVPGDAAVLVKQQDLVDVQLHRVKSGETLWSLSKEYGVGVDRIKKYNQLKSDIIKSGEKLKFPYFKTLYLLKIEKDDTLWSISRQYGTTVDRLKAINELAANTIYPDQHLLIIKDNPDIFYQENQLPGQEEVFVSLRDHNWIMDAMSNLADNNLTKEEVEKEFAQEDSISRMELAVMLERILYQLQTAKVTIEPVEAGGQSQGEEQVIIEDINDDGQVTAVEGDSQTAEELLTEDEIGTSADKMDLTPEKVEQLEKLVEFLKQELTAMNIKVEKLEGQTRNLETGVKEVNSDVDEVNQEVAAVKQEVAAEKEYNRQFTEFKLEGLTKVEGLSLKRESTGQEAQALNQIFYVNLHSMLSREKIMDFFLQAQYDYLAEGGSTEIIIGAEGDFAFNSQRYRVNFAHQQPFDASAGIKQTYIDLGWVLDTPTISTDLRSAHRNHPGGNDKLNYLDLSVGQRLGFNLNYSEHNPYFSSIYVSGQPVLEDRYLIDPFVLLNGLTAQPITDTIKQQKYQLFFQLADEVKFKAGLLDINELKGTALGFSVDNSEWNWDTDAVLWGEDSIYDYSFKSELAYKGSLLKAKVGANYAIMEDLVFSKIYTEEIIPLTEVLDLSFKYSVLNEFETFTTIGGGLAFKF